MTVAGVGMMALTDSSMKTNAALGTTAISLGKTKEEMREIALETANVTFPLSEVTASFDLLTRAGMENADNIAVTATAFDTLGDAIGLPASEVTSRLIPAFNAFNIPLEEAAEHTDVFTHLMRNTTVELSDFSGMVNYLAADLDTMDISLEESAAIMEVLADKGIQGSAATREFRTAITSAAKAPEELAKANRDLTKAEDKLIEVQDKQTLAVNKARTAVAAAVGSPEKLAKAEARLGEVQGKATIAISKAQAAVDEKKKSLDAAGTSQEAFYDALGITAAEVATYTEEITGAEGMTQQFADAQNEQFTTMDKLKHALSEATLQYGSLLEPVEALGPVMTTLGPIMILASTMNWAHAASAWAAVAPYLAIAAPIIAVIAVLYILEKRFGLVTKTIKFVTDVFSDLVDWLSDAIPKAIDTTINFVTGLGDNLLFVLGPIGAVIYAFKHWDEIIGIISGVFRRIFDFLMNIDKEFKKAGWNLMIAFANGIISGITKAIDAVKDAVGMVRSYLPGSDAKVGPLSDLTASGAALMTTFEKGIATSSADPAAAFAARAPQVPAAGGGSTSYSSSVSMGDVNLSSDYNFEALMKDINKHQAQNRTQRGAV